MDNNCSFMWKIMGPGVAGAVFGAGWWFWVDAVVCSSVKISFLHYLPGIFASLAVLMFNCVKKEDISYDYYSPYGESEWRNIKFREVLIAYWLMMPVDSNCSGIIRIKLWLFIAYVVSFVSLAGGVGMLVQDALTDKGPSTWTGVAGVLQCVFVLISGLMYWTCHSED